MLFRYDLVISHGLRIGMPKKGKKRNGGSQVKESLCGSDEVSSCEENNDGSGRSYARRQIQSNWDRYKTPSPETVQYEGEGSKSNDFTNLVNLPSDCNFFQFKSEKNWESEANSSGFGGHKFFNLDVDILSAGLACIPFYEKFDIDKSMLSQSDIDRCDKKVEKSLSYYKLIKDKFLAKLEKDYELSQSLMESIGAVSNLEDRNTPKLVENDVNSEEHEVETTAEHSLEENILKDERSSEAKIMYQKSCEEENLEDWLNSVLDD